MVFINIKKIIIISLLILLISSSAAYTINLTEEESLSSAETDKISLYSNLDQETVKLINNAISLDTYFQCTSKKQLEKQLANFFTYPILEDLKEDLWNFIKEPTDWPYTQKIIGGYQLFNNNNKRVIYTIIEDKDVGTNLTYREKILFYLSKDDDKWKIYSFKLI